MTRSQNSYDHFAILIMSMVVSILLLSSQSFADGRTLRVGVYNNPPKLLLNQQGQLSGILGDLLSEIAKRENWQIEPVQCEWQQCLDWLQHDKIDLMPDVAFSDQRTRFFQFHKIPALRSWSQIYTNSKQTISSLLDLDGKRIAILEGSIQQQYLADLTNKFGLHVKWVAVGTMKQGFADVLNGNADAVAANNLIGDFKAQQYDLVEAPVLFQPTKLYYAAPLHRNTDVLNRIDYYLALWKKQPDSIYYQILHNWNEVGENKKIPPYIWWSVAILIIALSIILIFNWVLRKQIAEKTKSLTESQVRLNTILDSVDANIYIKNTDLRYQYVNRKLADLIGMPADDIVGKTDLELFFDAENSKNVLMNDARVVEFAERVAVEENIKIGEHIHNFYSVKIPLCQPDGEVYALCGISTDMTEYQQIQQQLHNLAFYDPLTGLANRRLLLENLNRRVTKDTPDNREGAVFLIDIDGFKTLNESMGHNAGDTMLHQVAMRLQELVSEDVTAARLGADEFVMVVDDLHSDRKSALLKANNFAEKLMLQLNRPYALKDINYVISVSIGIAMFSDAPDSAEKLLQYVDLAVHRAKEMGRGTICFFNLDMQSEVKRRNYLETALREAIEKQRLQLHVQPQFNSKREITGMEALARWQDGELGIVSPAEFIPLAEATNLIVPLGEWVLTAACQALADWSQLPQTQNLTLAVNISPKQFRHPGFINYVESTLEKLAIDAELLEFEITESLLIDDLDNTIERMKYLSSLGIRFSLDDFGTGYASLSYLKLLPLDKLKIDQSFVRDMLTDANDEAIITTIMSLGNSLEMQVIAEGVETVEQLERLQQLGCDYYQGYLFGKPETVKHWQNQLCQ